MEKYEEKGATLFWGIGIENESYLQWSVRRGIEDFKGLKTKRERYSVDYYKSFLPGPMDTVLADLKGKPALTYPIYMNAHTLQKTDERLCHSTLYDTANTHNPDFTEPIHDILMKTCPVYRETYDTSVVFDGDTIEFITQEYYCTTVSKAIEELVSTKTKWIEAVGPCLTRMAMENLWDVPKEIESKSHFQFPSRNEGLVTFLTTEQKNLGICNTQTLHLNITLPTWIQDGVIVDKDRFAADHLAFISMIQVVEPLIVATYGTPDIFSVINPEYSIGSQRATRSRYISLQSFDVGAPVNGKLLLRPRPEDPTHWYNRLVHSPYQLHTDIGYDINFNKFKNHGVEIRFLDWFPEEHLKGLMDFFILLGHHACSVGASSYRKEDYHDIILTCIRKGFTGTLSATEATLILRDCGLLEEGQEKKQEEKKQEEKKQEKEGASLSPYQLLDHINALLFQRYRDTDIIQKMSPGLIDPPQLVNYNQLAFQEMYSTTNGRPPLVIRAEASVFEHRVALTPEAIHHLLPTFTIYVESSATRCFSDQMYKEAGAIIIPSGTWMTYPNAVIVGLKGLRRGEVPHPSQTLFHFAHCFKQQEGWRETMETLRECQFIDYEFMLDDAGKRTLSFCKQAGHVGGYLTLLTYYGWRSPLSFTNESAMNTFLMKHIPSRIRPRILMVGHGTVGKSCLAVFERFGLSCTVKRSTDIVSTEEILSYDIYVHAIRLIPERDMPPFMVDADIDRAGRKLTLVADLSCDLGHPMNPLPIYHHYGTKERPIQRLRDGGFITPPDGPILFSPPLDLLAVPYLPSFDPLRSSVEFSEECVWYLSEWEWMGVRPMKNHMTRAMARSLDAFANAKRGLKE